MSDYDNLHIDRDDGAVTVTLDSTAGQNAVTMGMANELLEVATTLSENDECRAIVLTHDGDFFGAGADLTAFDGDASDAPLMRRLAGRLHESIVQLHRTEVPVIGGINGVAAGAGFSLAIMPDLVLLSDEARLEYAYPRIGLVGDGGSTFFLPRLVGLRRAREIVLLDEPIGPDRALDLGLATEVVAADEFDDRLDDLVGDLAAGPTAAYGATKRLMTESFETSLEAQLSAETDAMAEAVTTADYSTGLEAFFDKREPDFVGR